MATQYVTLLVHAVDHTAFDVSGAVGPVGLAVIAGAALSPAGGWISDKLGFRQVLVGAIAGLALTFVAMALVPSVLWLAVVYGLAIGFMTIVGAMVSSLLATEVPAQRRSATLNLIYLPLYFGGITGPAIGAGVVGAGLRAVFYVAAAILAVALVLAVAFARRTGPAARGVAADSLPPEPSDRVV
jgi:MFS family permease